MRFQRDVGVRRVLRRQVRREVVEAAVVRLADEGDAAEERLGGFRGGRRVVDVAEAVLALVYVVSALWGDT